MASIRNGPLTSTERDGSHGAGGGGGGVGATADWQPTSSTAHVQARSAWSGKRRIEPPFGDRKSTRLNSSHGYISYAVFCLKKKKKYSSTRHANSNGSSSTDSPS